MLKHHAVSNGDIETVFYDEGEGPPFVLVHGFTGSRIDFHDQVPWFSDQYRVLVPDQRGHGESTRAARPEGYSLNRLADDLAGFLDALALGSVHLLGHSMGGMVALRFALRHPERLRSLILMDTAAEALRMFPRDLRAQLAADVRAHGCGKRIDAMRAMPVTPAIQRGIDFLGADEHWRRLQLKLEQMDPEAWVALADEIMEQPSILDDLAGLAVPTTVIVGAHDLPFLEPSARMAAAIPGARHHVMPLAAHSPQYEDPETWRLAVSAHLARAR